MLNKRGIELSLNLVIAAVMLLSVLIIVISLYSGGISTFSKKINECRAKGGFCASKSGFGNSCNSEKGYYEINALCPSEGDSSNFVVCCLPIKGSKQ